MNGDEEELAAAQAEMDQTHAAIRDVYMEQGGMSQLEASYEAWVDIVDILESVMDGLAE